MRGTGGVLTTHACVIGVNFVKFFSVTRATRRLATCRGEREHVRSEEEKGGIHKPHTGLLLPCPFRERSTGDVWDLTRRSGLTLVGRNAKNEERREDGI